LPHFLHELADALESQKADDVDRIMDELQRQPLDSNLKEALERVSDEVLMAEYGKAGEIIKPFLRARV
jgi:hypothetical protein